jgi:two-component system sensor histidine kinase RegB
MAVGQAATALIAEYALRIDLPLAWMAPVPLLLLASNVLLARRLSSTASVFRIPTATLVGWVFCLDALCLTGLLMLSGGPSNPFTLLYLVHITLAATILTNRQTWTLGGLSTFCFASLFWIYRPVPELGLHHQGDLHFLGMWISFTVAVALVALYAAKISLLLRDHEEYLLRVQEELARKDRLASLVTLAAGAAHELSTPLGTIAIAAKELERLAGQASLSPAISEDSRLIRQEVSRCREILQRMSTEGAEPAGEASEIVPAEEILNAVGESFPERLNVSASRSRNLPALRIPRRAVIQALAALVKNGLEASPDHAKVELSAAALNGGVRFIIQDRGHGMSAETLRRVGEPFFTSKEPGKGMGLGVFLTRTLAERLGGALTFESESESGTRAIIDFPAELVVQNADARTSPV